MQDNMASGASARNSEALEGASDQIFQRLTQILRDVFDETDLIVTPDLSAKRVAAWDSLGNVRLFLEIERKFGVRFTGTEMTSLRNVGELAAVIRIKIAEHS